MPDLATFRPQSADEFAQGVLEQVVGLLETKFKRFKAEMTSYVEDLGRATLTTAKLLKDGSYTPQDADLALHAQEMFLNNIVLRAEYLVYELAQSVLETIFGVVKAVVKNLTGFDLKF